MLPPTGVLFDKLPRPLRRHRLMLLWMRITREETLQLIRIRKDAFAYADLSDGFLRMIVIEKNWEADFFRIAGRLLAGGGVFIDVGANHGLLSFGLASELADRVLFHLFEPNAELTASIERSRKLYPGVTMVVNNQALGEAAGSVSMHFERGHLGMSHVVSSGGVPVSAETLDRYVAQQSLSEIKLLKLDVEGYEVSVLRGAGRTLDKGIIDAVYFEHEQKWLRRNHSGQSVLEYLGAKGYEVCFCRTDNLDGRTGQRVTFASGHPGHGLPLRRVMNGPFPPATDLLAVRQDLLIEDSPVRVD